MKNSLEREQEKSVRVELQLAQVTEGRVRVEKQLASLQEALEEVGALHLISVCPVLPSFELRT